MITEQIRRLIENIPYIFIATADSSGQPHMATGEQVIISGDSLMICALMVFFQRNPL